ncbi:MAG: DUF6179 domain-containing protein [Gordonibacter sp.]|nr:DUF6179 domain-containing protein [Gordonibacter sp.]
MVSEVDALAMAQATGDLDARVGMPDSDLFQIQLMGVLAKQASLYTLGESSSLPEYDAFRLLGSVCFTLGVDPDEPDAQVLRALLDEGVDVAFARCCSELEAEAARTDALWKEVCLTTPLLESIALRDTLESLRGIGARYDVRFFSLEIPADIDYPLCHPVDEAVQGIRYVNTYLERLLVENRFLQCFEVEHCRRVLQAVHPQYGELIVNLFEPVATNAVGCALAQGVVRSLRVGSEERSRIVVLFEGCSPTQMKALLVQAAGEACDALGLGGDASVCAYVQKLAEGLVPRLQMALCNRSLNGVFMDC